MKKWKGEAREKSLYEGVEKIKEYWVAVLQFVGNGGGHSFSELLTLDIFDFLQLLKIQKQKLKK